jgi:two-component sensor histidine kinase
VKYLETTGALMKVSIRNSSLHIAGVYAVAASLWIVLSDRMLFFFAGDYSHLTTFQTFKGIFFVVATSVLLFFFSRAQLSKVVALQSKQRQDAIDALREKEVLLREVHHRVKNNMQVIVSLLGLKDDGETFIGDVRDKVRSMALVHELLYASPDMSTIDAADFVAGLAELMRASVAGGGMEISSEGDQFLVDASMAIPIGIFLVEACSNAIQHGRPGPAPMTEALHIHLSLRLEDAVIAATVQDNGRGFDTSILDGLEAASGMSAGGSGSALMDAVASQVRGTVIRRNDGGAFIQLRCPA